MKNHSLTLENDISFLAVVIIVLLVLKICLIRFGYSEIDNSVILAFIIGLTSLFFVRRKQIIISLFFAALVIFIGFYFLYPDKDIIGFNIPVIVYSLTVLSFTFLIKRIIEVKKKESKMNVEKIFGTKEIVRSCIVSRDFGFLGIIIFWLFLFVAALQKGIIMISTNPMEGLGVLIGYVYVSFVAVLLSYWGMLLATSGIKKKFFSVLLFMMILIMFFSTVSLLMMFRIPDILTPSSGL